MLAGLGITGKVGLLFGSIGLAMLVMAALIARHQLDFGRRAAVARGEVVDEKLSCSRDDTAVHPGAESCTYRPLVRFRTTAGQDIEFLSTMGSNPPDHRRGETVRVLYLTADPDQAAIDSWLDRWFITLVSGALGALFGAVGAALFGVDLAGLRRRAWARRNGTLVQADFTGVQRDTSTTVRGRNPYTLAAQWQDPKSGRVYRFVSADIWYDPSQYLQGRRQVGVRVDPADPRRYWMDTGFLPPAGN
ncbi:MAG: DUF3592 domain-containing protein [Nevskia sp.]|nr:DUF3592 domain-containing protein [Nevskia sp.]